MKLIKDKKYRRTAIIILIPVLLISQYYLFKYGVLRPMLKGVEINIVEGDYISDIDKYVIKVDDTLKLSMGDYIKIPTYAKDANLNFKVLDDTKIASIDKKGKEFYLKGLEEGYTSIGIMNGSNLLKKVTIKVVDPKVEYLEIELDNRLVYVGDSSKISATVESDYDQFKESEKVIYESSNESVLSIDNDNTVKAVGVGTATIYVKSGDKTVTKTFNIRARVSSINIDKKIEIEVDQVKKLYPNVVTSPKGLRHPKIDYALVGARLPISRAISLESDGTIVGIREGEEEVKITCGGVSEIVTVKVNKKSIEDKAIEDFSVTKEIIDNTMILTLTWNHIKDINDYEIYLRNNYLDEKEFTAIKNITISEEDSAIMEKIQTTIQIDITDIDEVDLDLYVVGLRGSEETKPSDMVNVQYKKEVEEVETINNISGYFDKDTNSVRVSWDPVNIQGVTYSVYTKDILNGEEEFKIYNQGITTNECIINTTEEEIELEIYVEASFDNKTIRSESIVIK